MNLEKLQFTKEGRPCRISGSFYVPLKDYEWWANEEGTITLWSLDGHEGLYRLTKRGYVRLLAGGVDMKQGERPHVFYDAD